MSIGGGRVGGGRVRLSLMSIGYHSPSVSIGYLSCQLAIILHQCQLAINLRKFPLVDIGGGGVRLSLSIGYQYRQFPLNNFRELCDLSLG